jgi:F-type H+-transporting ATPase subunit delta
MQNPRLAGRYAKSLLDLAIERNELDAIYKDVLFVQSLCKGNRDLVALLRSPVIAADKKESILTAITEGKVSVLMTSFNNLLIRKGREASLPEIVQAFIEQYKTHKNIHVVRLTTASELSEEMKNSIVQKVKEERKIENIELDVKVDPNIIGGFVLEVGDTLIDASIAYDLNAIKKQFLNNDFVYRIR